MVHLCNDYGLDTIEAGTTIAVAMDAGLIPFGDGKHAIELIEEIGKGTPLGRILGSGTNNAANVLGVVRNPTVKGQSMPAYDPRAVKGIGVTYATTAMGADHTAGYTIAPEILGVGGSADPAIVEGKADLSRNFQASTAVIDTTGHCLFIAFAILDIASGFQGVIDEVNGILGTELTADDAGALGMQILKVEREFNAAAGFTNAHDRLPEFMSYEAIAPHNVLFDVPDSVLDAVYADV
jgi:aldehyde:ferredoxin oxidoreductase